jgi:hypothetical protein
MHDDALSKVLGVDARKLVHEVSLDEHAAALVRGGEDARDWLVDPEHDAADRYPFFFSFTKIREKIKMI